MCVCEREGARETGRREGGREEGTFYTKCGRDADTDSRTTNSRPRSQDHVRVPRSQDHVRVLYDFLGRQDRQNIKTDYTETDYTMHYAAAGV